MSEDRLEKMESKIALLEDTVQELNHTVYQQQKTLDRLESMFAQVLAQVRDLAQSVGEQQVDETPPHY